jgi:hypothetical protein
MTDREKRRYESSAKAAFYSFIGLGIVTMVLIFLDKCS